MNIIRKLFGKQDVRSRPTEPIEEGSSELSVRGIKDCGLCSPKDGRGDPIPIISAFQLKAHLNSLPLRIIDGVVNLVILGNVSKVLPRDSVRYAIAFLRSNPDIGMLLWHDRHVIFARTKCLAEISNDGFSGGSLEQFIQKLLVSRWTARNIVLSMTPCLPFGDHDPGYVRESTALVPAQLLGARDTAERLASDAYPLLRSGSYAEALTKYDEAVDRCPEFALGWMNKGGCHMKLQQYQEAMESCDCALKLDPKSAGTWMNKGELLFHILGRLNDAEVCFREAARLGDPNASSEIEALAKARRR